MGRKQLVASCLQTGHEVSVFGAAEALAQHFMNAHQVAMDQRCWVKPKTGKERERETGREGERNGPTAQLQITSEKDFFF